MFGNILGFFTQSGISDKKNVAGKERYFDRTYFLETMPYNSQNYKNYQALAKDGYIKNVIVHRAINLITKNASTVNILLYSIQDNNNIIELNQNHPCVTLLKKPNPMINYAGLMESIIMNLLISGNAYIQLVRDQNNIPVELYSLRPDRVKIIPGNDIIPRSYIYNVDGIVTEFYCNSDNGISDILHLKLPHPLDDWYGLSPMEPAQYSVEQHNACLKWNKALLENGARPSGAFVVKNTITDEHYKRIRTELDDHFRGSDNAGKMMILEGGLDWKEMGINPKDMEFGNTKDSAARDIAGAFGVPAQLLGIKGDNTYSNMSEARLAFWEETIIPTLTLTLSKISCWISGIFNENIEIRADLDSVSILAEKRAQLYQALNNVNFINTQEKRDMMDFDHNNNNAIDNGTKKDEINNINNSGENEVNNINSIETENSLL